MARWIEIHDEGQFHHEIQRGALVAIFGDRSNMIWNMSLGPIQGGAEFLPLDKVLSIDTNELPGLVQEREVKTIPTARFFFNGRKISELTGKDVTVENIHKSVEKLHQAASQED